MSRRSSLGAAAALAASLLVVSCATSATETRPASLPLAPTPVTQPEFTAAPGTLIDATEVDVDQDAYAWRIVYHSESASGADRAVTGLLVTPREPAPPGGRPLVTWGHPTTGTADKCAPSLNGPLAIPILEEVLDRGWAVVASDFEGLGTEGPHPYLDGRSGGQNVLDAARAASQVDGSGVATDSPVVIWGFSQGGHAALFAAELASAYAPELDVRAVAAVAPVADTHQFWRRAAQRPDQVGVATMIAHGLAAADPTLDPADVLTADAVDKLPLLEVLCVGDAVNTFVGPVDDVVAGDPAAIPGWLDAFDANRAGEAPIGMPVLVAQGGEDDIVYPEVAVGLVARLCAHGDTVTVVERPTAGHGDIPTADVAPWLAARLDGAPAGSDC